MHGDLTRSKSNKGSVDGQFSHEFLHRPVWRGRLVGFCAGWPVPVQLYQAAERLFLHTRTSMVRSCATTTAGPSRRRLKNFVRQDRSSEAEPRFTPHVSRFLGATRERPLVKGAPRRARVGRVRKATFSASCSDIWNLPVNWSHPGIGEFSVDVREASASEKLLG